MKAQHQPIDDEQLDSFLRTFQPRARAITASFRIPAEDGEDLLQDVLLIYLLKRERIYSIEGWLAVTLRKQCIMYWRRRRQSLTTQVDEAVLELLAPKHQADQESIFDRRDLDRTLEALPDRCRSVLSLRYRRDLTPTEIARSLGYQSSGIYKILERCLGAFSRLLVLNGMKEA